VIESVGVVVPARDEELLLPGCLEALGRARTALWSRFPVRVHVVVVLDRCSDGSADAVTRLPGAVAVSIDAGNVGRARAAGADLLTRLEHGTRPSRVWLATTDADSVVPEDWLERQVELARSGAIAVVGTVAVTDWSGHQPEVREHWTASYVAQDRHPHVHGANLGCTLEAYHRAGGFRPLAGDEDVALVAALGTQGVVRTAAIPVRTSSRVAPRAAGGFGDHLRRLEESLATPGGRPQLAAGAGCLNVENLR
jgi:glycosyltransferase involved in cell wall biosynthesis